MHVSIKEDLFPYIIAISNAHSFSTRTTNDKQSLYLAVFSAAILATNLYPVQDV